MKIFKEGVRDNEKREREGRILNQWSKNYCTIDQSLIKQLGSNLLLNIKMIHDILTLLLNLTLMCLFRLIMKEIKIQYLGQAIIRIIVGLSQKRSLKI